MKRSLSPLLGCALSLSLLLAGCAADTPAESAAAPSADPSPSSAAETGAGTPADPYQISTPEQLDAMRDDLTASYLLTADIDLSGFENWVPIGNMVYDDVNMETGEMDMTKAFSGSLDGDGHPVSNLACAAGEDQLTVGLLGGFTGSVTDLAVENAAVTGVAATKAVGGVVGYAMGGSVTGVTLSGKNTITGTNCVGGIVGGNMAAVTKCTVENADIVVIGDNDFSSGRILQVDVAECGGLVAGGTFAGTVDDCTATGTITATGNEPVGLGGISGCIQCTPAITGNTATVTINAGNGHAIGGLCGYAGMGDDGDGIVDEPCKITDCSVTVTINADGATHVGGLVGTGMYYFGMEDRFTVENCSVTGTINGAVTPGTVAGRAEGSTITSCDATVTVDGAASTTQVGTTDKMYESADQYE